MSLVRIPSAKEINFCTALTLRFYAASFGRLSLLLVAGVLHMELGLKIHIYVLRLLIVVSDCIGAGVQNDNNNNNSNNNNKNKNNNNYNNNYNQTVSRLYRGSKENVWHGM